MIKAAAAAPTMLLSVFIVSPCDIFLLIIPSRSFDCQSNKAQRICENESCKRHHPLTRTTQSFCSSSTKGDPLSLPLATHEIEIAAFVGLQDRLVEQMGVAALGPVRRR